MSRRRTMILYDQFLLASLLLLSIQKQATSFTLTYQALSSLPSKAAKFIANGGDYQLLATATSADIDITEIMRQESLSQYSDVMDHFMLERDNGMVFLKNAQETSKYIDANFDAILFDCDGVLYRGTDPIPDAAASLESLLKQNKKVLFVTNNAGSSRMQLRDKLANILDCPNLEESQMVCSGYSAARYVEKTFKERGGSVDADVRMKDLNVHIIGTEGLCEEFRKFGATVSGGPSEDKISSSMSREELASHTFEEELGTCSSSSSRSTNKIDAVCVGLDTEFNYRKLRIANVLLQRFPDALLVATNEDAYDLVGLDARHLPGNGSLVKAIECCSQREAINVGKPSKILADLLSEEHGLDPSRTLFVGDRLDTDVKFGKDGGMKSALVLTGCTTSEKLIEIDKGEVTEDEPLPDIIFPHIGMMGLNVD